jgi:hypothetical protein
VRRFFKPAPPHNSLFDGAPAMCMCVDCCRRVLALRCPAKNNKGWQCGNYRWHKKSEGHWALVATVFQIAEERIRLDGVAK